MEVRGRKMTPEKAAWAAMQDITGKTRVPSPLRWQGSKGRPHYIGPLRDAFNRVGRHRRLVDPFLGGGNIPLNLQPERALLSDLNPNLINAFAHIQNPDGFSVDWSQFTNEDDVVDKETYYERLRGGTPTGMGSWPPSQGSVNDLMLNLPPQEERSPEEKMLMAQMWLMMQQSGWQGGARGDFGNYTDLPYGSPIKYPPSWDYSHYAPLMQGWDLRNMGIEEVMENGLIIPEEDFLVLDSPYYMERGTYTPGGFDDLQQPMAEWAGGLARQGLPVVAFNSAFARPFYDAEGFDTVLNTRMDRSGGKGAERGPRPEMIAYANIPGLDWFKHYPQQRYMEQGKLFGKSQDAFAVGWSVLYH